MIPSGFQSLFVCWGVLCLENDTDLAHSELCIQAEEDRDGGGKRAVKRADVYNG